MSVEVHRGIDERVRGAAIFRLDVIRDVTRLYVRIVAEKHSSVRPDLRAEMKPLRGNLSTAFDPVALESLL